MQGPVRKGGAAPTLGSVQPFVEGEGRLAEGNAVHEARMKDLLRRRRQYGNLLAGKTVHIIMQKVLLVRQVMFEHMCMIPNPIHLPHSFHLSTFLQSIFRENGRHFCLPSKDSHNLIFLISVPTLGPAHRVCLLIARL